MRTITHPTAAVLIIFLFILISCERVDDDILSLMPDNTQLMFENDYVRVLDITLEPGEAQPLHECGDRFIYAQGNYTITYYQPDDTMQISWNEGGIHFHERGYHAVENSGETTVHYFLIERSDTELPVAAGIAAGPDPVFAESEFVTHVFENAHARISRVNLSAGERIPDHEGLSRLIYSLSDYEIIYVSEMEGTVEMTFKAGDFHWHDAGLHSVENIGTDEAEYLVFEFLQ